MNPSTLIGMVVSLLLMAVILFFASDDPWQFIDAPSLAIVFGGTIAATFLSFPLREVRRIVTLVRHVLKEERLNTRHDIEELVAMARLWMRGDLQAVERALASVTNPFLRTGVQLVIDRTPENEIIDLLQWRIASLRNREMAEAQIFRVMASYAPAFGMLGTLLGLINLMDLVGAGDMKAIGSQLGIALLTTFYGVLAANLIFKPIAVKLERRTEERLIVMNMVLEGISLMCAGRSPSLMRETLKAFVARHENEIYDGAGQAAARKRA